MTMIQITEAEHQDLLAAKAQAEKLLADAGRYTDEIARLTALLNEPITAYFIEGVKVEIAHQVLRWGEAHDRSKSAEAWYWLVAYLAGKALRCAIEGDREKALHHTISTAAALGNWHKAIIADETVIGLGEDADLAAKQAKMLPGYAITWKCFKITTADGDWYYVASSLADASMYHCQRFNLPLEGNTAQEMVEVPLSLEFPIAPANPQTQRVLDRLVEFMLGGATPPLVVAGPWYD
jgi:hypothetical protein